MTTDNATARRWKDSRKTFAGKGLVIAIYGFSFSTSCTVLFVGGRDDECGRRICGTLPLVPYLVLWPACSLWSCSSSYDQVSHRPRDTLLEGLVLGSHVVHELLHILSTE